MMIRFPAGDYVSPGLERVDLDFAFPNKVIGDPRANECPYLRREIPHNWYVDRRVPWMGFVNRDEAHLVYNNALQWRGKRALEIGCWMGWSAAHLVVSGVDLDVVDPSLADPVIQQSVVESLNAVIQRFRVRSQLVLHPRESPAEVERLASQGARWSFFFIDGKHEAPGPLEDAIVCDRSAERDAMILFHDLAASDVAQGIDYLRERGWNTLVYQTMQIMGVAWRGEAQAVKHQPDPNVDWNLPAHLQGYPISAG